MPPALAALPGIFSAAAPLAAAGGSFLLNQDAQQKAQGAQSGFINQASNLIGSEGSPILGEGGFLADAFGTQTDLNTQAVFDPSIGLVGGLGEISKIGDASKQSVLDREQEARGEATARAASTGLFNSTQLDASFRGIYSDTNKVLSQIDEAIAAMTLGQKNKIAAGVAGLGDIAAKQGIAKASFQSSLADLFGGIQVKGAPPVDLSGIASSLSSTISDLFGQAA